MSSTIPYTLLSSDSCNVNQNDNDNKVIQNVASSTVNYSSTHQSTTKTDSTACDKQSTPSTTKWLWDGISKSVGGFRRRNTGLLLVIAAEGFFGTLMNFSVKTLHGIDPPISTLQLILVRMGITYICSIVYMLATGIKDPFIGPKGVRGLLLARGLFGFLGLFGIYFSLEYLSLSDATVLTFLSPLCTAFAGALFLGEYLSYKQVMAGFVSFAGVILIARPPFLFGGTSSGSTPDEKRMLAVLVALIGVTGATGSYTSLRAIGKRAHPMHSMISFSWQCVLAAVVGMMITKEPFAIPAKPLMLIMLVLIGVFGFVAQILLSMGLSRETAGRGTMALYVQIVFATILERIFFHTVPPLLSVLGTILIISSAIYVALMKADPGNNVTDSPPVLSRTPDEESGLLEHQK